MPDILRVTFKKCENMRYMGHLDVLRTFVRGMRRAEIPFKYSEGFNPHAVMTFALPLGVGTTSECEIADIKTAEYIEPSAFKERLNNFMPPNSIEIVSAEYTEEKMPEIVKARYEILYENDGAFNAHAISEAVSAGEIMVEKKSKRQSKSVNLAEHIFEHNVEQIDDTRFKLYVTVSAGGKFNIKPQLLTDGFVKVCAGFRPLVTLPCRKKFIFEDKN